MWCVVELEEHIAPSVHEIKVDFGPGYRVYFGWDGEQLVILLAGGTKQRQSKDIANAKEFWKDYKASKRREAPECL